MVINLWQLPLTQCRYPGTEGRLHVDIQIKLTSGEVSRIKKNVLKLGKQQGVHMEGSEEKQALLQRIESRWVEEKV